MTIPPPIGTFVLDFRGFDYVRYRTCVMLAKGDSHVVTVDDAMVRRGWDGGQGVRFVDSDFGDEPVVSYSDGLYGGFLLWGSDETADQFISSTRSQLAHPMSVVMFAGNCVISTSTYERYTWLSRTSGGPLVELQYVPSDPLYFSSRGFWTKEDEMTLSAAPMAPAFFTGFCIQIPARGNQFFLGVQTSL